MNIDQLADALDYFKGCMFERLAKKGITRNLGIVGMFTGQWTSPIDFDLYAELLHANRRNIVSTSRINLPNFDRSKYFEQACGHDGDLFLDPDIGVWTSGSPISKYVYANEIKCLLTDERLVIVYQHIRGQNVLNRLKTVCKALKGVGINQNCICAYMSGTVALIFLSAEPKRITDVRNYFKNFLGTHYPNRIWP